MTINFWRFPSPPDLLSDEDVLPLMHRWQAAGQRIALVTLVDIEGGSPRYHGAQMAVGEDGRHAGYLSGGCLEAAVVLEAQAVIAAGRNRLVRYGRGSPYFDIRLPCGSGLDLYFDQAIGPDLVGEMVALSAARRSFALRTTLSTGASTVDEVEAGAAVEQSRRDSDVFKRVYSPALRLLLLGGGPALVGLAKLSAAVGIDLTIVSHDEATKRELAGSGLGMSIEIDQQFGAIDKLDFASAAVLYFHDHGNEPELLSRLLRTKCFYIGALGNHAVHRERLAALAAQGFGPSDLARIRAPVGSIAGAKSTATLGVGVLAEMMGQAKALNLVS